MEITEFIENEIKLLTKYDSETPLKAGIGFPVGISINNVAAHFTPSIEHNPIIKGDDLVKIDYGVHIIITSNLSSLFNIIVQIIL